MPGAASPTIPAARRSGQSAAGVNPPSRGAREPNCASTCDPPGWLSERDGRAWKYHRTHVIGDRFGGEWRAGNLFTGFREMNDPGMKRCENRMANALASQLRAVFCPAAVW
ncbi:DNA/RNA non-specific endonuclease [Streptomyces spongiicola]|uniref:DNA/RNA non-specific endonuclease n=1 Tax=Streptomyces spongiicola TaxID=1690221 RepID=UPI000E2E4C4A